ncbi:hypothetical protein [Streptomyces sp. NBC_00083]|uniref:hypothetical protein n=1 Tax=Streptomyces sp. NBC_00083 TaxID=2975647 RepID=UPI00225B4DD1|nr:hypothetical protein [Streptomyces sp. NBC_00083]MCX5387106.1 hypothetical protein [Streptomyces sp. NBC_00083]
MPTIAVTGHMDLTPDSVGPVRAALREILGACTPGLVGRSCLAPGADTLFAQEVLDLDGRLCAVIPSRDYREAEVGAADLARFDALCAAADEVAVMPYDHAGRAAYEAANRRLIEGADRLVAVWDGGAPTGRGGGTADLVAEARAAGVPVDVVWPPGSRRSGGDGTA